MNNYKYLSVQIADDLSGIDTYSATLNGEWILMEYDYKTKKLVHNLKDEKASNDKPRTKTTNSYKGSEQLNIKWSEAVLKYGADWN